jgi:hypothetical protein
MTKGEKRLCYGLGAIVCAVLIPVCPALATSKLLFLYQYCTAQDDPPDEDKKDDKNKRKA